MIVYKTSITGSAKGDEKLRINYIMNGHWNPNKCAALLKRKGCTSGRIEWLAWDTSGHGRSGHDGRWVWDIKTGLTKKANWKEFGKEH